MTVMKRDTDSAGQVRNYGFAPVIATPTPDPSEGELMRLRRHVADLERDLADAVSENENAYVRGCVDGRAEANDRAAERGEALLDGMMKAVSTLDKRIGAERDLAIDIAQAVLGAMIGTAVPYRDLVVATAAHHAAVLGNSAVIRLSVSAEDFPDSSALAGLPKLYPDVEVVADASLAAGSCRFDLTLGSLDASIRGQLAAANDLLDRSRRGGDHGA